MLSEELGEAGIGDRFEIRLVLGERVRQGRRGRRSQFRGRRLDDDFDQFITSELAFEHDLALHPVELIRKQRIDVGIDGEVGGRIVGAGQRHEQADGDDRPRMAQAEVDDIYDSRSQHVGR